MKNIIFLFVLFTITLGHAQNVLIKNVSDFNELKVIFRGQ